MLNWLHYVWFAYFWPSLKGNGPEALVQTVVYAVVGYLFYPPFHNWINNWFAGVHEKTDLLHDKLDHIIENHPDIPTFPLSHKDDDA